MRVLDELLLANNFLYQFIQCKKHRKEILMMIPDGTFHKTCLGKSHVRYVKTSRIYVD